MERIAGIDHIGIVVRDLDSTAKLYSALLGLEEFGREELAQQGVMVLGLRCGSQVVELLTPTRSDSGVARFLDSRGEGLHHVAYRVPDVAAELDRLRAQGAELVDDAPRRGFGGHLVAFVHPRSLSGVLTELVADSGGHP